MRSRNLDLSPPARPTDSATLEDRLYILRNVLPEALLLSFDWRPALFFSTRPFVLPSSATGCFFCALAGVNETCFSPTPPPLRPFICALLDCLLVALPAARSPNDCVCRARCTRGSTLEEETCILGPAFCCWSFARPFSCRW